MEYKLKTTDKTLLEKYIQVERLKAATRNRAGDKTGAREAFAAYKQLEKRLQTLNSTQQSTLLVAPQPAASQSQSAVPVIASQPQQQTSQQTLQSQQPTSQAIEQLLKTRSMQYKQAAVSFKRQQNLTKAKEMLAIVRQIDELQEQLSIGLSVKQSAVPPEPKVDSNNNSKSAVDLNINSNVDNINDKDSKLSELTKDNNNNELLKDLNRLKLSNDSSGLCGLIERQIKQQESTCATLAANYLKAGDKQQALIFHKYKKQFGQDLLQLLSRKQQQQQNSTAPPPAFQLKSVQYSMEKSNLDISPQDLELQIVRAIGLSGGKEVQSTSIQPYCSWEISGWPDASSTLKGDTEVSVSSSIDPEFNYKRLIKIDRSKTFQRFLERKKATVEVWHYRGFLRKSISLGKATVKLEDLLRKAEIHDYFDLMDVVNGKRSTGGKLELKFRLRQPLLSPEIIQINDNWIFLDSPINTSSSPVTSPVTSAVVNTPVASTSPAVTSTFPSSAVTSPSNTKTSPNTTNANTSTNTSNVDESDLIEEFERLVLTRVNYNVIIIISIDLIVSNNVLEFEQKSVNMEIEALQKKKLTVPDELTDRRQQIEIKLSLLILQVQSGKLTMDAYLGQLREAVVTVKQQALAFKRLNNLEMAKRALKRLAILQQELEV